MGGITNEKALTVLFSLLLVAALLPFALHTATAEGKTSGTCGDDLTWTFDEETGTLTIEGSGIMEDYDFGCNYTPWTAYRESIKSVVIGDQVTSIGVGSFSDFYGMESATIGNSVTSIGDKAFYYCCLLPSFTIPADVTSIGELAFTNCYRLQQFIVDSGNNAYSAIDDVLFTYDQTKLIAFPPAKQATSYMIPSAVTSILERAFSIATR